jgi:Fur family ferric uptake transcriptional regulator
MTVVAQSHQHVARDVADALAVVRAHGLRLTDARRRVLDALFAVHRPATADEIAAGLGRALADSDLASVYRNLETLEKIGLVRHLHFGHGAGLYELMRVERRVYALCERCESVTAVTAHELDAVRETLDRLLGVTPRFSHFPIVGVCRSCRAADEDDRLQDGRDHAHS